MKKLIAGNWKMNGLREDARALVDGLVEKAGSPDPDYDMAICPPATLLETVSLSLTGSAISLGGQDCSPHDKGAHTGDISAAMLADLGCRYVIVGHSERRQDHHETDGLIAEKAEAALRHGLIPIICVGETLEQRDSGEAEDVVARQLEGSIPESAHNDVIVVAYEPVWAIGTGRVPEDQDIAGMHMHIRARLGDLVADAARVRILYGGSVKDTNATKILAIADVDGVLVGGASLDANGFAAIAAAAGAGE